MFVPLLNCRSAIRSWFYRTSRRIRCMRHCSAHRSLLFLLGIATLGSCVFQPPAADPAHREMAPHSAGIDTSPGEPRGPFIIDSSKSSDQLLHESMAIMSDGMRHAPMSGDPDHDFASMMIPHHQGAIDMAKIEILYGKDPVLRRLAQEIIVTQDSEIAVMRRQLERNSGRLSAPR